MDRINRHKTIIPAIKIIKEKVLLLYVIFTELCLDCCSHMFVFFYDATSLLNKRENKGLLLSCLSEVSCGTSIRCSSSVKGLIVSNSPGRCRSHLQNRKKNERMPHIKTQWTMRPFVFAQFTCLLLFTMLNKKHTSL